MSENFAGGEGIWVRSWREESLAWPHSKKMFMWSTTDGETIRQKYRKSSRSKGSRDRK